MPSFRIQDKGTLGQVLDAIGPELKVSGRKALGVLVDADDSLADRWGDLSNRCRAANIDLPQQPTATGTILEPGNGRPRIGIWLMPDNESPGELEDFVQTMVPSDDPVWPRSENYIDRISSSGSQISTGQVAPGEAVRLARNARESRPHGCRDPRTRPAGRRRSRIDFRPVAAVVVQVTSPDGNKTCRLHHSSKKPSTLGPTPAAA